MARPPAFPRSSAPAFEVIHAVPIVGQELKHLLEYFRRAMPYSPHVQALQRRRSHHRARPRLVVAGAGEVPRGRSARGGRRRPRVLGLRGPPQRHDGTERGGRQAAGGVEPGAGALHGHDPRLLRPGRPGRGHAVTGDLRQRELPDAPTLRRCAVSHVRRPRPRRCLRAGVERLRARRVVRRRPGDVRADGDLPTVGPGAGRGRDPSLCGEGRAGAVLRRGPATARSSVVPSPRPLGPRVPRV